MDALPMPLVAEHVVMHRAEFFWKQASYDEWFLVIPIRGCFSCTMQSRTQMISEGDLCFFPPGIPFSRHVVEELDFHYIHITWNCSEDRLKSLHCYPVGFISLSNKSRLQNSLHMLGLIAFNHSLLHTEITTHYVRDIWLQYLADYTNTFCELPTLTNDPAINQAIDFINNHLHMPVPMSEVAKQCQLSHTQFSKRFSKVVGLSPVKYLTYMKIKKAQTLLSDTELPISDIAFMCGYESPFYFSKRFHKTVGISPRAYRQNLQNLNII